MHSRVLVVFALLCGIAAALELPQMGGLATPRKAKRSMEITMVKRKEEWDRRMRARASLEERGFFDWVGGFFDGSKNCYYDGYPAFSKTCASTSAPYIRSPTGINAQESAYLRTRKIAALSTFQAWLNNMKIPGMPSPSVSNFPNVAVAFSGGGLRAMLSGAGVFDGMDSRSSIASPNLKAGRPTVNGLLNFATYMTGLSGGSWLIGASAQNNWATIDTLRSQIWKKPQLIPDWTDSGFSFGNMGSDFIRKNKNFPDLVSLTDIWGWFIGYGLISRGQSPATTLFKDVTAKSAYTAGQMPFPIVVTNQQANGSSYNAQDPNVPIVEVSPIEFGDWQTRGFIRTDTMGTTFNSASSTLKCMANFGLTQWILGASSAVFPGALPQLDTYSDVIIAWIKDAQSSFWMKPVLAVINKVSPELGELVYSKNPNPSATFQKIASKGYLTSNVYNPWKFAINGKPNGDFSAPDGPILRLNDGGMDWQNLPIAPLLYRNVDVIIANDNSGDTTDMWPNGTSLYMTMQWARRNGLAFPDVPSPNEIMSKGINDRPAFYGCNATSGPLIVWIPASAAISGANGVVNIPTLTFSVEQNLVQTFIQNGNANILRGPNTLGYSKTPSNWPQCVACGVMQRQLRKLNNGTMPATCQQCFSTMCYS